MRVANDSGNLVYDSENPLCTMDAYHSQGKNFAFLTVMDIGSENCPIDPPMTKRYWGEFSWDDQESSIERILATGGKWPDLRD